MTIIPYNLNNSISRLQFNTSWKKILFTPDTKLQTTEIEEIQDLLYNQLKNAYSSLYDFYTIVKGCQVIILNINSTNYNCLLTEGQVYVEFKNKMAFFIDIPSINFSVDRSNTTDIGVIFNFYKLIDELDFRNPHTGGAAFGSEGASRITIEAEIIVSSKNNPYPNGFYPIAIIKPKTASFVLNNNDLSGGYPDIIYYRNEELTTSYNEINTSTYIKKLIELRLYESSGNFIAKGLHCFINTRTNVLCISPGIAYINGIRIETNYNNYFLLDPNEINDQEIVLNNQYIFYLTDKNIFDFKKQIQGDSTLLEVPANALALCYVYLNNRDNLLLNYSIIEAPTRMPSISNLIKLNQSNEKNIKDLAELALKADLLNLTFSNTNEKLNGIFTDSFNDLDNSDIFFPEFAASILPAIQAISLPFTSSLRDNRTFTIDQSNSNILIETILNENNEVVPYWSTIQGNQIKYFNSPVNITKSITIPVSPNSISVIASPSIIYKSDASTFVNYTHPNIKFLTGLETAVEIDTPFNNNTYNRNVTVYAKGFPANQDNIKAEINNSLINNFNIISGETGSVNNTLKANSGGNLSFTFNIPNLNNTKTFTITLNYADKKGSTTLTVIDPELERVKRENTGVFIEQNKVCLDTVNSGLAQVIQLTQPAMLTAVECYVLDYPSIQEGDILNVQITSVDSLGKPKDCLGFGSLSITDIPVLNPERPVPTPALIKFNKPINLNRGKYAISFYTSIQGVKLGAVKASENRLLDGKTFYYDPLKLQVLYYDNEWKTSTEVDNISCDLILHKPLSLLSSTYINIDNSGNLFDLVDINLSIENDTNSYFNIYILNEKNQFDLVQNGSYFFKTSVSSTKIRIDMSGTTNTHPILNLDNVSLNLITTKPKTVWISKNQEYESPYKNLNFSVELFKPNNTNYKFYFSSNKGVSWEQLENPVVEVVNNLLPLYKYTFNKEDLELVSLNSEVSQRLNLRYKIEIEVDNLDGLYPFFKNIISITNP